MADLEQPGEILPLKRTSLRDDAARTLRSQIVAGTILPDRLYSIGEIAAQLGTSPTPVREALLELGNQGLIELVRNRGFRVQAISQEDLQEILDMRILLEVPALCRLAEMEPQPNLEDSKRLCGRVLEHARAGNVMAFLTIDRDFHLSLIRKIGNDRLTAAVETLRDQTRLYGMNHMTKEQLEESAQEHFAILDAIAGKQPDKVETLLKAHLQHVSAEWSRGNGS